MTYGYLDTRFVDFPPNVDVNYLRGLTTAAGVSFTSILTALDARLRALNSVVDPLVAQLIHFTDQPVADQTSPSAFVLNEENEYGLPRPQLAEGQAVMLPLKRYVESLAFTEDYLERASPATITNQFDSVAMGFTRGARINVLRRLTSDAEVRVDRNTSATSPGFAGSGTGQNIFAGTYPDGTAPAGGYTLYYRDTAANLSAVLKTMRNELLKWWPGPFELIGSNAQITAVAALPEFIRATSAFVTPGSGTAVANVDATRYLGVFDGNVLVQLGVNEFGTSPNLVMFKDFGNLSAASALAWRYDAGFGRGVNIRYRSLYPLDQALARQRYGIGVSNRVAAANLTVAASGGYVPPVIA